MKIGVVSLFNLRNVNFGNRLQAFALNTYVKSLLPEDQVYSICLNKWGNKQVTNWFLFSLGRVMSVMDKIFVRKGTEHSVDLSKRLENFNVFSIKYHKIINEDLQISRIVRDQQFDIVIVGSDIVWGQDRGYINRDLFLEFPLKDNSKKISYAASIGSKSIPRENRKAIQSALSSYEAVSVRESSLVSLLNECGVQNAKYVLDPTFLLTPGQWRDCSNEPQLDNEIIENGYIFTYLLSDDAETRIQIQRLAARRGLQIITVPYASGHYNQADKDFDAIKLMNLSPTEWLWLVDNAEFVITDSFHGCALSTIFEKKFIVTRRIAKKNINERMQDFLNNTKQSHKLVSLSELEDLDDISQDYGPVDLELVHLIQNSKDFIKGALSEGDELAAKKADI